MVNVRCDNCGKVFQLSPEHILRSIVKLDDGYSEVCYFVCSKCATFTVVSVNNEKWNELKSEFDKYKARFGRLCKAKAGSGAMTTYDTLLKKKEKLSSYTSKLFAECQEKLQLKRVYGKYILVNRQ